jgi:hypothetical protein
MSSHEAFIDGRSRAGRRGTPADGPSDAPMSPPMVPFEPAVVALGAFGLDAITVSLQQHKVDCSLAPCWHAISAGLVVAQVGTATILMQLKCTLRCCG